MKWPQCFNDKKGVGFIFYDSWCFLEIVKKIFLSGWGVILGMGISGIYINHNIIWYKYWNTI